MRTQAPCNQTATHYLKSLVMAIAIIGSLLAPAWGADHSNQVPLQIVAIGADPSTQEVRTFTHPQHRTALFFIPDGHAFVVKDIVMVGQAKPGEFADKGSVVWVRVDDQPLYEARYMRAMHYASFASGLVIPAGKQIEAINWSFHPYLINVKLMGYLVDITSSKPTL